MLLKMLNLMVMLVKIEVNTRSVALLSIFIAIVFVFTVLVAISIPATRGFWNIGEAGVYLAALIGGPMIGGIAGGIGSALADIFLGYAIYAPGTLIIKGAEGFITGSLYKILSKEMDEKMRYAAFVIALIIAVALSFVFFYFGSLVGYIDIELASEPLGIAFSVRIHYTVLLIVVSFIAIVGIILIFWGKDTAIMVFSCLIGGMIMVVGYFLYETLIFGSSIALVEIIPNFMQAFIGIIIAIPVVKRLRELGVIDRD